MVLLTLSKKVNQWLGPFLLRHCLRARYGLDGGIVRDRPGLDAALLLPFAMRLISLEVHEEGQRLSAKQGREVNEKVSEFDSELRVRLLENYLRPALLPNECWSDVRRWQFHHRLLKWARHEFLLAKYGTELRAVLDAFSALRQSPQLTNKLRGSAVIDLLAGKLPFDNNEKGHQTKLPSSKLVLDAFGMRDWSKHKDSTAVGREMARICKQLNGQLIELRGGAIRVANIPDETDLSSVSLEDVLEVAGAHVKTCGSFNVMCEEAGVYQLWTKEYIQHLCRYLLSRAESFSGQTLVVDVGAGDGLLAESLRDFFEASVQGGIKRHGRSRRSQPKQPSLRNPSKIPTVVATDNDSWGISKKADVENMTVEDAIRQYTSNENWQVIVLCSWMPMNEDWSYVFRDGRVDEYILIGECDDGQCGDNWETWGNREYLTDVGEELMAVLSSQPASAAPSVQDDATPRPYEADGYKRKDMDELCPYQFSRFDCSVSKSGKTVSFLNTKRRIN